MTPEQSGHVSHTSISICPLSLSLCIGQVLKQVTSIPISTELSTRVAGLSAKPESHVDCGVRFPLALWQENHRTMSRTFMYAYMLHCGFSCGYVWVLRMAKKALYVHDVAERVHFLYASDETALR